jgi:hypothetical protein
MATINITPDPPVAGQVLKICYDGPLPASFKLTWTPPGPPGTATIPAGTNPPCTKVNVPAGSSGLLIHDSSGLATDLTRVF